VHCIESAEIHYIAITLPFWPVAVLVVAVLVCASFDLSPFDQFSIVFLTLLGITVKKMLQWI
jgi:hypothetical protein